MSVHMRKRHTRRQQESTEHAHNASMLYVIDNNVTYVIPKKIAERYVVEFKQASHTRENVSANEVFSELDKKHTKAGALLKGVRARENLSQVKFAKRIHVTQANLSKMENGKRPIGKSIAKRIEKEFAVNYRYFLE